ncbi:hypothetical protein AO262_32360 [Pseudomonas fluorescens ABAC62]|nr:hypothetical protein AO262_32360 [Pseudomonas fluorescens ABAC62]
MKLGTVTSDASGNWSYTTSTLSEGPHSFTATVTTAAGGESTPTGVFDLTIDLTAPGKPGTGGLGSIDNVEDDFGSVQGPIANGGTTDDNTPTFSGGGQNPGDKVTLIDGGNIIGEAVVDGSGNWSITPGTPLGDGTHDVTMVVSDPAGNASTPSDPFTVVINTTAPAARATIEHMGKDSGTADDFLTNDGSAGRLIQGSLTAALAAGEKVEVSVDGGASWEDAVLNGDGTWSFVDETRHASSWEVQARVVNSGGSASTESSQSVTLDKTAPPTPSAVNIGSSSVTVEFDGSKAEVGDTMVLSVGNNQYEHVLTTADIAAGSIAFPVTATTSVDVTARIMDKAGNYSGDYGQVIERKNFDLPDSPYQTFRDFDFFTVSSTNGGETRIQTAWNVLSMSDGTHTFDLSAPASKVTMSLDAINTPDNTITYYDMYGNVLKTVNLLNGLSSHTYTAPPGSQIGQIVIKVDESANSDAGISIEDMTFVTTQEVDSANQLVDHVSDYQGGSEDNVFTLTNMLFMNSPEMNISGNGGIDTLKLSGQNQTLDLTKVGDHISSIEVIDLKGSGDNTLKLSLEDVLNNGEVDLFHSSGKTQMMVNGDAGDKVDLQGLIDAMDPGSWGAMGQVTVGGVVYDVFSHSSLDAELLVQQGVTTNLV